MATTLDHSTLATPVHTKRFADGSATDYCLVSPPSWAFNVTIKYDASATGVLYVACRGTTDVTGVAAATDDSFAIDPGGSLTLQLVGKKGVAVFPKFSVWSSGGATQPMRFLYDSTPPPGW